SPVPGAATRLASLLLRRLISYKVFNELPTGWLHPMSSAHPVSPTGTIAKISPVSARPMKPPCFTRYSIAPGILGSRWITEEMTDVVPVLHSACFVAVGLDWRSLCLCRWHAAPCARPLAPPGRAPRRRAPPAPQLRLLQDRSGRPVAPANLRGRQHR